jgi:hypothetical protein
MRYLGIWSGCFEPDERRSGREDMVMLQDEALCDKRTWMNVMTQQLEIIEMQHDPKNTPTPTHPNTHLCSSCSIGHHAIKNCLL